MVQRVLMTVFRRAGTLDSAALAMSIHNRDEPGYHEMMH